MAEAFICSALRTPIGRYGGALAMVRPDDLAAVPLRALKERHPSVDWNALDDVVFGAMNVVGGYVVTDRMLQMFRKRPTAAKAGSEGASDAPGA